MNKQQLAAKIWESANQMRSKIEANEYKDYILGFIFYKYLSDNELKFARKEGCSDADIKALSEDDYETVKHFKSNIGYFIAHKDLFSTWINLGKDFDVSNVRDALSAFGRLINPAHRKLFQDIFKTLETGLSKLGDSAASQTKAISSLLQLIKDIPMALDQARQWASGFTNWYNEKHHHSAIKFVTPGQRHRGEDHEILTQRMLIYEKAKEKHPERWASTCRNWDRPDVVTLNHTRKNKDQAILELKEAA